jgi:hypothetical protein
MFPRLITDEALDLCVSALMAELLRRDGLAPITAYGTRCEIPSRVRILPGNDRDLEIGDWRAFMPDTPRFDHSYQMTLPPIPDATGWTPGGHDSLVRVARITAIRHLFRFTDYNLSEILEFVNGAYVKFVMANYQVTTVLRDVFAVYREGER